MTTKQNKGISALDLPRLDASTFPSYSILLHGDTDYEETLQPPPWRRLCSLFAPLDEDDPEDDLQGGCRIFRITATALAKQPEEYPETRRLLEGVVEIEPDFLPALLGLHMLYNWDPRIYSDKRHYDRFFHTEWGNKARYATIPMMRRTRDFFNWCDTRKWRLRDGRKVVGKIPPGIMNLHAFWCDIAVGDMHNAILLWEEASQIRFPPALNSVGVCAAHGEGVKKNENLALEYFVDGGQIQGHANTLRNLGWTYETMHRDEDAAEATKRACDMKHAPAMVDMAAFYVEGKGGCPCNANRASEILHDAVDQGDPWAQVQLANFYQRAVGVPRASCRKAEQLLLKSASQDNNIAVVSLCALYSGVGNDANGDFDTSFDDEDSRRAILQGARGLKQLPEDRVPVNLTLALEYLKLGLERGDLRCAAGLLGDILAQESIELEAVIQCLGVLLNNGRDVLKSNLRGFGLNQFFVLVSSIGLERFLKSVKIDGYEEEDEEEGDGNDEQELNILDDLAQEEGDGSDEEELSDEDDDE